MLLFIAEKISLNGKAGSFNTSHVTLYHGNSLLGKGLIRFQYISCYSLSVELNMKMPWVFCFNTSHVTLYRRGDCKEDWTGNVSIHLMLLFIAPYTYRCNSYSDVSIHLMLLFIQWEPCHFPVFLPFQYISCYSLSLIL